MTKEQEAQRAFRIRKAIKNKKAVPSVDRRWLADYQKRTGKFLVPQLLLTAPAPAPADTVTTPTAAVETQPTPVQTEPEPQTDTAAQMSGAPDSEPPPVSIPGFESEPVEPEQAETKSKKSEPTPEQREQYAMLVQVIMGVVRGNNTKLKEEFPDAFVLPEPVLDKVFQPALERVLPRIMPQVDMNSEIVDAVVVGVVGVYPIGMLMYLKDKRKKSERQVSMGREPPSAAASSSPSATIDMEETSNGWRTPSNGIVDSGTTLPNPFANTR